METSLRAEWATLGYPVFMKFHFTLLYAMDFILVLGMHVPMDQYAATKTADLFMEQKRIP